MVSSFARTLLVLSALFSFWPRVEAQDANLILPEDFEYLGAIRVPGGDIGTSSFANTDGVLALNPDGDQGGPDDGHPGSLYLSGHIREEQVAEINIPTPVRSATKRWQDLPSARVLTSFKDPTGGLRDSTGIPSGDFRLGGMVVFNGKLYWTCYRWYNVAGAQHPSHGACELLSASNLSSKGVWFLGDYHSQMVGGPITVIPRDVADQHLGGKRLASGLQVTTGRATTSHGPSLFAFQVPSSPPANLSKLTVDPLVYYPSTNPLQDYVACDAWRGVSWISSGGRATVLFTGKKSYGESFYGEGRPGDCEPWKGYHCDPYDFIITFYNPADLIAVAKGQRSPYTAKPYKSYSVKAQMWPKCDGRLGGCAFDERLGYLYVVQPAAYQEMADGPRLPLIHVWKLSDSGTPRDTVPPEPPQALQVEQGD